MLSEQFASATYCLINAENNMSSRNVNAGPQDATTIQVPKKILSVALAMCTTMSASMAMAADAPISLNTETISASSGLQLKYRPAPADKAIDDQYIVILKSDYIDEEIAVTESVSISSMSASSLKAMRKQKILSITEDISGNYNANVRQHFTSAVQGFTATMDEAEMKDLMLDERVDYIEQDQIVTTTATQSNATWGLDRIDQDDLPLDSQYTYDLDGSGVTAYIIDTGILASHSNFGGRVTSGYDAIGDGNGTNDCNGHGTHVAGTVGSTTYGVAKDVELVAVRVLGCTGSGTNSGVIAGVDWVAANASGPSVANMSLGGSNSTALDNAVNSAINAGITFVVAAGNDNSDACSGSPNKVPAALTIASSTSTDARSSFSNYGSCIDMFAPGSSITSTWSNGGTNTISGTSMAAPHVAGAAALYLQSNPNASPAQVEAALESAAATNKISSVSGSPNLLLQTTFGTTTPTPTPTPTPTTPTPTPTPGGADPIDIIREDISVSRRSWVRYTLALEEGYSTLSVSISGGTGDADLYVNYGSQSSTFSYDCRPYLSGNNEECTFSDPDSGTWHIDIYGYTAASGITLNVTAD